MLPGLELLTAAGLTVLAGGSAPVQCNLPKAPMIRINPVTAPIKYDFSHSEDELGAMKSNTINPYIGQGNIDTATGGLRSDSPVSKMQVQWGMMQYPGNIYCLWYDTVDVSIQLQPTIYVASEFKSGKCHDAILAHEQRHVEVDHQVINLYSKEIGAALADAINGAGAMGPYNYHEIEGMQKRLIQHVQSAIQSKELMLSEKMRAEQAQVDTLEEYERVSAICNAESQKSKGRHRR